MNFLLVALVAVTVSSAEPAGVHPGTVLSRGPGYRVTGRLTFDRRKAASGGYIYALARPSPLDDQAVRLSEAVVTASPGVLGRAAALARRHGLPALAVTRGRWENGALSVRLPVFAEKKMSSGYTLRLVERYETRQLKEDEVISVDPVKGLLVVFEEQGQAFELDLAQALRAFDGLKDAQALIQWYEARREDSGTLAARLAQELTVRVAAGTATTADFTRVKKSLLEGLSPEAKRRVEEESSRASAREMKSLLRELEEFEESVANAGSRLALDRLEKQARSIGTGAKSLALAVGSPNQSNTVLAAARRVAERARSRRSAVVDRGPEAALAAAGAPMPPSVKIPVEAYARFLAQNSLSSRLEEISQDASLDRRRKNERVAVLFAAAGLELSQKLPEGPFLSVMGAQGDKPRVPRALVAQAVKELWAMSWRDKPEVTISAVPDAQVSGVAFSRDPVSGRVQPLIQSSDERTLSAAQRQRVERAAQALDRYYGQNVGLRFAFVSEKLYSLSWSRE